jgi:hypothetical protein
MMIQPDRLKLNREGARIIIAIQDGRWGTNRAGRYMIDGEERPDRKTRERLQKRGLIEWRYIVGHGYKWHVTPKGEATLARDLHELAEEART